MPRGKSNHNKKNAARRFRKQMKTLDLSGGFFSLQVAVKNNKNVTCLHGESHAQLIKRSLGSARTVECSRCGEVLRLAEVRSSVKKEACQT